MENKIKSTYLFFKNKNKKEIKNPTKYTVKLDNIKEWLSGDDNIVCIKKGKDFNINENVLMVQRYIHNELGFSYKSIIDIEILCKKNSNVIRYPDILSSSVDFTVNISTIINNCKLSKIDELYIIVLVSYHNKIISLNTNRYLFLETRKYELKKRGKELKVNNLFINNNDTKTYNGISNDKTHLLDELFDNKGLDTKIVDNLEKEREEKLKLFEKEGDYKDLKNTDIKYEYSRTFEIKSRELIDIFSNIFIEYSITQRPFSNFTNGLIDRYVELYYIPTEIPLESTKVTLTDKDIKKYTETITFNEIKNKSLKVKNQEKCVICLNNYKNDDMVSYLNNCNHLFHKKCIDKWLKEYNNKCPICRKMSDKKY